MARKKALAIVTGVAAATVGMLTVPWNALADQVILDDLIVDGSACIGQDCVNGESFGFDTIRLKENNLRIKALDTSSTASFPSNDWQLTFNESSNGGLNKFSVDDITGGRTPFTIEAGAPSHSLYVEDGGRVGIGTSTPVVQIHNVDGNTPTLRMEQDGSSGFTPQTWDVAGNEANFFIRDATNGSQLPFRIFPDAGSDSLVIKDNNIGIGTTSPQKAIDIVRNGPAAFQLDNTTVEPWEYRVGNAGNFVINENPAGLDGPEMVVTPEGDLRLGGNCIQFDGFHIPVTSAGTATIVAGNCP